MAPCLWCVCVCACVRDCVQVTVRDLQGDVVNQLASKCELLALSVLQADAAFIQRYGAMELKEMPPGSWLYGKAANHHQENGPLLDLPVNGYTQPRSFPTLIHCNVSHTVSSAVQQPTGQAARPLCTSLNEVAYFICLCLSVLRR